MRVYINYTKTLQGAAMSLNAAKLQSPNKSWKIVGSDSLSPVATAFVSFFCKLLNSGPARNYCTTGISFNL